MIVSSAGFSGLSAFAVSGNERIWSYCGLYHSFRFDKLS